MNTTTARGNIVLTANLDGVDLLVQVHDDTGTLRAALAAAGITTLTGEVARRDTTHRWGPPAPLTQEERPFVVALTAPTGDDPFAAPADTVDPLATDNRFWGLGAAHRAALIYLDRVANRDAGMWVYTGLASDQHIYRQVPDLIEESPETCGLFRLTAAGREVLGTR